MASFDQDAFQNFDVTKGATWIEDSAKERIISHVNAQVQNGTKYSRVNPLVIADIGCGSGEFMKTLVKNDIPSSINNITCLLYDPFGDKNNGISLFDNVDFQTKTASNSCDIIYVHGAAHLFKNFDEFLINCQRILKSNGLLMIVSMYDKLIFPWGKYAQHMGIIIKS